MKTFSSREIDRCKPLLFVFGLYPLLRWVWLGWHDGLTANPTEFLTRSSGTWALVCLLFTLAVSPLRQAIKQPAFVRLRRMCGLFTFFYAVLHALSWAWWDQGFAIDGMLRDIWKRPFILVGVAAFLTMTLLALTSTQGWMRRLGSKWQRLHRTIYVIGVLAILHYWWHKAGKNDLQTVMIYAGVLAALLLWRLVRWRISQARPRA